MKPLSEKSHSQKPPSKNWDPVKPLAHFCKFGRRINLPQQKDGAGGGGGFMIFLHVFLHSIEVSTRLIHGEREISHSSNKECRSKNLTEKATNISLNKHLLITKKMKVVIYLRFHWSITVVKTQRIMKSKRLKSYQYGTV